MNKLGKFAGKDVVPHLIFSFVNEFIGLVDEEP